MKAWESTVNKSKRNLWLVTTKCKKLLCTKTDGEFFVKSPARLVVRSNLIVRACKL